VRRLGELDERTSRAVARIHAAAERASALIRDLLDFTKARTAGGIAITPQPLDLHQQARRVAQEVHAIHPTRALDIQQQGEGEGYWDPARIAQVVENLVSNAFKYGAEDAPVVVRTLGGERWVRLEVHNGGKAIDPALLPHIFEPLRQGAAAGAVGGVTGVGLGLYIVDHIVRAHGGTIDVHSTPSEGTTFIVRLPREPPAGL
jgi:signal transduction histidine kinase